MISHQHRWIIANYWQAPFPTFWWRGLWVGVMIGASTWTLWSWYGPPHWQSAGFSKNREVKNSTGIMNTTIKSRYITWVGSRCWITQGGEVMDSVRLAGQRTTQWEGGLGDDARRASGRQREASNTRQFSCGQHNKRMRVEDMQQCQGRWQQREGIRDTTARLVVIVVIDVGHWRRPPSIFQCNINKHSGNYPQILCLFARASGWTMHGLIRGGYVLITKSNIILLLTIISTLCASKFTKNAV